MRRIRFRKAVLFGTGLIGASLGRDLLRLKIADAVIGIDPSPKNLVAAKRAGAVTGTTQTAEKELRDADLVIFAAPVSVIRALASRYAASIPVTALVIDVGSTKGAIAKVAKGSFPGGNFVGCHPMAGTENSGAAASLNGLFSGKTCFIVAGGAGTRAVRDAKKLWGALGATPAVIGPKAHDKFAAWVSHLPHFVAFALMNSVSAAGLARVKKFAGGGLRDTTRIAASSPGMWNDIFLENGDAILAAIAGFKRQLSRLEAALRKRDGRGLSKSLSEAAKARRRVFP